MCRNLLQVNFARTRRRSFLMSLEQDKTRAFVCKLENYTKNFCSCNTNHELFLLVQFVIIKKYYKNKQKCLFEFFCHTFFLSEIIVKYRKYTQKYFA